MLNFNDTKVCIQLLYTILVVPPSLMCVCVCVCVLCMHVCVCTKLLSVCVFHSLFLIAQLLRQGHQLWHAEEDHHLLQEGHLPR